MSELTVMDVIEEYEDSFSQQFHLVEHITDGDHCGCCRYCIAKGFTAEEVEFVSDAAKEGRKLVKCLKHSKLVTKIAKADRLLPMFINDDSVCSLYKSQWIVKLLIGKFKAEGSDE